MWSAPCRSRITTGSSQLDPYVHAFELCSRDADDGHERRVLGLVGQHLQAHQGLPVRALLLGLRRRHRPGVARSTPSPWAPPGGPARGSWPTSPPRTRATSCRRWSAASSSTPRTCCSWPASRWPGWRWRSRWRSASRMVVGVIMSYALQPKGDALLLGIGVALAIVAVIMDGKAYGRLAQARPASSRKSIVVCIVSGVLMGSFAPFVTRALTAGHALTPYSIAVFFTLAAFSGLLRRQHLLHEEAAGRARRWTSPAIFASAARGSRPRPAGRRHLGHGQRLQFRGGELHRRGDLLRHRPGRAHGRGALGRLRLARVRGRRARAKVYLALMFLFYILALIAIASAYNAA